MRVYCVLVFGILFAVDLTSTTDSTFINIFTCVQACKGWIIDTFPTVCDKCVANPPVSRKLCDFACSNTYVNKRNHEHLRSICTACFNDAALMKSMCNNECKSDPLKYYPLCNGCVERQIIPKTLY